jgi:hypothetical protein
MVKKQAMGDDFLNKGGPEGPRGCFINPSVGYNLQQGPLQNED